MSEVVEQAVLPVPQPAPNPDTVEFWKATADGRLLFTRCNACGEAVWYPRPICPFCHSSDTAWEESSGRGTIYTYTIVHRGPGPWASASPYVAAYVQLEEGPRMMTNIVDCDPATLEIGQAVELIFHKVDDESSIPRFRPAQP
jgi:uncharacterized OB-fold protein